MLDIALEFLRDELNTYLQARTGSNSVAVKLSRIVDDTGKVAFDSQTIGACVLNVEEERTLKTQLPQYTYQNGQHVVREPDLKLNLYIIFAGNFTVYEEALKNLSYLLLYFQANPAFTQDGFPALDPRIAKLVMELQSPTFDNLNQIWTFIGGKQLPSIIYKMRLVMLQPDAPSGVQPPITTVTAALQQK